MAYLNNITDADVPLTAAQLNNGSPTAAPGGMLPNGMATAPNPNQAPNNLAQLARNKESAYLTDPPEQARLKAMQNIDPSKINKDYIAGMRARQEDDRANKISDMLGEKHAFERTDRMEKRQIDEGMRQAAQEGGYTGVIDFLKTADPDRAIAFDAKKTELDQGMMKTTMMQSLLPVEQAKAMVEGYGVLGKMGMAIMNAPPQERQNMYEQMMPMIHKINPDAPTNVNQAAGMFLLGAAQATPENILFKAKTDVNTYQSKQGKLSNDIQAGLKAGRNPETDAGMRAMVAELQKSELDLQQAKMNLTNNEINQQNKNKAASQKVISTNETFNNNLQRDSKQYIEFMGTYTPAKALMDRLRSDPTESYAQIMLSRSAVKQMNRGASSDIDSETGFIAAGYPELKKKIQSVAGGEKVNLNENEVSALIKVYDSMAQKQYQQQLSVENNFKTSAETEQYRDVIDWNTVRKPSTSFHGIDDKPAGNVPNVNGLTASPEDIAVTVSDPRYLPLFMKKYGYDPNKTNPQQQTPAGSPQAPQIGGE